MNFKDLYTLCFQLLILTHSLSAFAETITPFDGVRDKPGFSAQIPDTICKKEFPFYKTVSRKLHAAQSPTNFSVFSFTTRKFDPTVDSILVIHGGPGGMWHPSGAKAIADQFPNYNVVFFHYRGGGCSSFPSSEKSLDTHINSIATIADLEGIRAAYGINKWKSIVGLSYGTNIARMYAHFFPDRTDTIILEGLDQPIRKNGPKKTLDEVDTIQSKNIIEIIKKRYHDSRMLSLFIKADAFDYFAENLLIQYLSQISVMANYTYMGLWDTYQDQYINFYKTQNLTLPRYFNKDTFAAISMLAYSNNDEGVDGVILGLISQFVDINLPNSFIEIFHNNMTNYSYMFFPFLNPNYLEYFKNGQLVSMRVQLAMTENDQRNSYEDFCTNIRTLVINGTVDSATPIANAISYLKDKSCSRNEGNLMLEVVNGGHSNLASMKCLSEFADGFINKAQETNKLKNCSLPVNAQKF